MALVCLAWNLKRMAILRPRLEVEGNCGVSVAKNPLKTGFETVTLPRILIFPLPRG
jgi:hypothetical protein